MEKDNKRIIGLDIIKAIAIIFVIIRHVPLVIFDCVESLSQGWAYQLFINLATCGVPLFFAVDGYLLLSKKDFDLDRYLKKLFKIIILYFAWSFILIIINLLFDQTTIDRFIILDLLLKLRDTSLYTSELWFLEALFAIYLIYPLIWQVFNKEEKVYNTLLFALIFFTVFPNLINIISSFLNNQYHVFYMNKFVELINKFNIFKYEWHLLYFMIGGFIYKHKTMLLGYRVQLISTGLISLLFSFIYLYIVSAKGIFYENYNDESLFEIFIILGFFAMFLDVNKNSKIISLIGKNTFGIYVNHQYAIRIVRLFVRQDYILQRLLIAILALVLSTIFTVLLSIVPFAKKIIKI